MPFARAVLLLSWVLLGCRVYDPELLERGQPHFDAPGSAPDAARPSPSPAPDAGDGMWGDASQPDAGSCGGACSLDNATATCTAGQCEITACVGRFLDCDVRADNGCEVDGADDPLHCGGCDNDCTALPNSAETRCAEESACQVVSCEAGFDSCDGQHGTGCETSLRSVDNCGGCASKSEHEPCVALPNVVASSCATQTCEIGSCVSGWANCDGRVDNGCEHDVGALGPCTPSLKRLSIDPAHVDAPLADFPVLVRLLGDADLTTARADGADLFFSTDGGPADGSTALSFELEAWNRASGDLVAWVRLPAVSDVEETVFFLRYGDGVDYSGGNSESDVWGAQFESVHHFGDGLGESTGNPIAASNQGSSAEPEGQIAGARGFSGGASIAMSAGVLPGADRYTISAWVKVSLAGGDTIKYVMDTSESAMPYSGMALGLRQGDGAVGTHVGGDFRYSARDFVTDGTWHFVAARYLIAGSDGRFETSLDGRPFAAVFTGDTEDARTLATSPFEVGRWVGGQFYFDGGIDELRVSSVARSDAWIRAAYENQRTGSGFVRVAGSE